LLRLGKGNKKLSKYLTRDIGEKLDGHTQMKEAEAWGRVSLGLGRKKGGLQERVS